MCVEQVAHNAPLLLFGSRSQDGRFHNAFKWHITGRKPRRTAKNNFTRSQRGAATKRKRKQDVSERSGGTVSYIFNCRPLNKYKKGENQTKGSEAVVCFFSVKQSELN